MQETVEKAFTSHILRYVGVGLISGSIEFVRDYWRGLKGAGVPVEKIYTEAFF
jgi:hypothetical protein